MMDEYSNDDVFKMLDYIAFRCRVSLFKDVFINNVVEWYSKNTNEDAMFSTFQAETLWTSINKRGVVETYQEFITDTDICNALAYALNND